MSNLRISWQGEILAQSGYGVHARRILKPLIEAGVDVKLISDENYIPPEKRIQDAWWLEQLALSKNKPDAPVHINYCIPPLAKPVKDAINILSSQWDTTQFPREWVPTINQFNRFWVGSIGLTKTAANSGIKIPVDVVSTTLDTNLWSPEGGSASVTEIPPGCVKFMFTGDWIARKNYQDLIIGYLTAFSGCKDTALVIKTSSDQPGAEGRKHIEQAIRHFTGKVTGIELPRIYLLTDFVSEEQVIPIMRGCDVYLSVSHGESYDTAVVQAMSLGKIVVATNFLGHEDYIKQGNSLPVKYTLAPVYDAAAPLYHSYQLWSCPDMWDFISKMRTAYEMVKTGKQKELGIPARDTIIQSYGVEANTKKIIDLLSKISATAKPIVNQSMIQRVVSQLV